MSNYHLLTDVLYHQDGVVARKKNPVFPLVVVAAGIGLSIWSLNAPALEDSKNLSASLMLVGGVVALLGLIRLVLAFTGKRPVYGPTGETMTRKELFFEAQDRQALAGGFPGRRHGKNRADPARPQLQCAADDLHHSQRFLHTGSGAGVRTARIRRRDRCGAVFAGAVKEPQTAAKNVAVSA